MFDDKIVKLKKEQFIEAESVAYLIEDEDKRKIAFATTCALFAFRNYVEKNKYIYDPVTNINLFRVPAIYEKFEISDVYIGDVRIDVRVSFDGKVFPIPKTHIQNSIAADYYVVFKGTKNPLKCEGLGYIKKEDLVFDSHDSQYYYISVNILNPIEDLKKEIKNYKKEVRNFYETEHKIATENFGAFLDRELDNSKSLDLIEHLLNCENCRGNFVEYSFLEDVLTAVKHYPDLEEQLENEMAAPQGLPIIEETTETTDNSTAYDESLSDEKFNEKDTEEEFDFSSNEFIDIDSQNENIITDDNFTTPLVELDNSSVISDYVPDNYGSENAETPLVQEDYNMSNNILNEENQQPIELNEDFTEYNSEDSVDIISNEKEEPVIEIANVNTEPVLVNNIEQIEETPNNEETEIAPPEEQPKPEITYDTNWNELFSENAKPKKETDETEHIQPESLFEDEANSDIESVYSEENVMTDMSEEEISKEIETHVDTTKKPAGVSLVIIITVILTICVIGFFVFRKPIENLAHKTDAPNQEFTPSVGDSDSENMDMAMTNAFSDNQKTLEISNISWQKPQKLELTTELKEYLSALGASVWDDLDTEIQSVQGYIASNPAKIAVKINTKGEIESVKVKESSGAPEIDNVIVQAVKNNGEKLRPSAYSVLNQNIDLILLVNF